MLSRRTRNPRTCLPCHRSIMPDPPYHPSIAPICLVQTNSRPSYTPSIGSRPLPPRAPIRTRLHSIKI
ncbi:hypothetical protein BD311DRAFT_755187 [Dichomitus squalens]|uniref:Uncharacterized protein n=1 Tax=Dichomitus squalens TaxID=114155 RepID=A0A4Q9MUF7_9APHY|nr:hypothetical protein BD311DRAFT_755187 [Dichomitus squalens]